MGPHGLLRLCGFVALRAPKHSLRAERLIVGGWRPAGPGIVGVDGRTARCEDSDRQAPPISQRGTEAES
jgi:hypothetical protein